jgi:preprotein translocase SecE subunit
MAVVEKPTTKPAVTANPAQRLAVASLAGGLFLLLCLGLVFSLLPLLWDATVGKILTDPRGLNNPYLSTSLLLIVTAGVVAGLVVVARKLEGPDPLPGLRAGAAFSVIGLFLTMLIMIGVARLVGPQDFGAASGFITWAAALIVGGALVAGMYLLLQHPRISPTLAELENQGWFHATFFKASQGLKVRRGTQIALLLIGLAGVFSAWRSDMFRMILSGPRWAVMEVTLPLLGNVLGSYELYNPRNSWIISLSDRSDYFMFLLFNVQYTVPLLLILFFIWVTWRVTNWPAFADFLIATEAEMNKVSWTTRRRLIQDTIVVLVTVVLLTLFLFVVDIVWINLLRGWGPEGHEFPGVLRFDPLVQQQRQRESTDW